MKALEFILMQNVKINEIGRKVRFFITVFLVPRRRFNKEYDANPIN